ncbi:organic cation/carnitine transporter 2-like [Mercenaria mercenaria]|uniref:organic cation/carnitine transporter 2-like n=1 Tax=Mercenaria mercenaria TaxID=6596 RepID=UPI00234EA43A|nr:organic cation/carnitine transporter 2-like [Mercenaria mercenaria]XP_053393554.1 organic cation/carnitine transporter 2-like [Mercenaria mercenaria]
MIVYTTEIYPTVVRTIAYGVHSTAARVGGMVAPQIVFLDDEIPGILYFLSGVLMMISAVIMMLYRETKDAVLEDMLDVDIKVDGREKMVDNFETSTHL